MNQQKFLDLKKKIHFDGFESVAKELQLNCAINVNDLGQIEIFIPGMSEDWAGVFQENGQLILCVPKLTIGSAAITLVNEISADMIKIHKYLSE